MPQDHVFEEARERADKFVPEPGLLKDAPSIAPEQPPYTFENGTPYLPPAKSEAAFILDRGFDAPA